MPIVRSTSRPPLVQFLPPADKDLIKGWRKLSKEVDEFYFTWERWKRWETDPPLVISLPPGPIIGYHGLSFTGLKQKKSVRYINSASQFVLPEYRGRGLAGKMIDALFVEAHARQMHRIRFRTPMQGDGADCWKGFGALPFAHDNHDYWYDLPISEIENLEQFMLLAPTLATMPTSCKRRIALYKKSNLIIVQPEWKGIF